MTGSNGGVEDENWVGADGEIDKEGMWKSHYRSQRMLSVENIPQGTTDQTLWAVCF